MNLDELRARLVAAVDRAERAQAEADIAVQACPAVPERETASGYPKAGWLV